MDSSNAEKAWEVYVGRAGFWTGSDRFAFKAGRASRDAEVAELREQLAAAEAVIEKMREALGHKDWTYSHATLWGMITTAPSVVLEDRDREVEARALDRAVEAIRENAGPENSDGICEGVSNWPRGHAAAYTTAVVEAVESIHALRAAIRKGSDHE